MKSQSLIGRVTPLFVPVYWKNIKYYSRYYSNLLQFVGVVAFAVTVVTFLILSAVQSHHDNIANAVKTAHYQVGQTIVCNLSEDDIQDDSGWHPCKITSISKDKTHYQVTFQSPSQHRTIDFNFSVLDVGQK